MPISPGENHANPAAGPAAAPAAHHPSSKWNGRGFHVLLILLGGALARIPFYLAFRPILSGDSEGYSALYAHWVNHHFYLGERTPVYPFFLGFAQWIASATPARALGARAAYDAIGMQSIADVLAATLFYFALGALCIRPRTALAFTLFLVTIPAVCQYEMNILNMSLSFAWLIVVISLFLFTVQRIESGKPISALSVATGVCASLAILNRPEFLIFLIVLLALVVLMSLTSSRERPAANPLRKVAFLVTLSATPAILAWMIIMYAGIGQFRITTINGWNKTRTVYNLFDRVDPEDRVIGGIMAQTYNQEKQSGGVNLREIVWPAERRIFQNVSTYPGLDIDVTANPSLFHQQVNRAVQHAFGFVDLPCSTKLVDYCWEMMRLKIDTGDYIGRVSDKLARKYPGAWLANLATNFAEESFNFNYFAASPSTRDSVNVAAGGGDLIIRRALANPISWAAKLSVPFLLFTYLATLACFFLSPITFFRKHDEHWFRDAAVTTLAVASIGTLVGTCVLAGLNRVYSLPHLAVFTMCSAYLWQNRVRIFAGDAREMVRAARGTGANENALVAISERKGTSEKDSAFQ